MRKNFRDSFAKPSNAFGITYLTMLSRFRNTSKVVFYENLQAAFYYSALERGQIIDTNLIPCMHTCHSEAVRSSSGGFVIGHSTSVFSCSSHIQSVGVACSHCVIQHSLSSFSDDSGRVSGPRYSGSRSTSGDTGEGQLVRVKCQVPRYCDSPYGEISQQRMPGK